MITVTAADETTTVLTNLPGWKLVRAEMFDRQCAEGAFMAAYPLFASYGEGLDTNGKAAGTGSHYSDSNLSVVAGQLRVHLRPDAAGKASGAAFWPKPTPGSPGSALFMNQTYGRYEIRMRSDAVSGYKAACLLWSATNNWNDGEVDWPEGSLNAGPTAFNHWPGAPRSQDQYPWPALPVPLKFNVMHTYAIEWSPALVRFLCDETEIGRSLRAPTAAMHPVLQFETNIGGVQPTAADSGYVYIDHIGVWSYAP